MKIYLVWRIAPSGWSTSKDLIGAFKKKEDAEEYAKKYKHSGDPSDFTDCDINTYVEEITVK